MQRADSYRGHGVEQSDLQLTVKFYLTLADMPKIQSIVWLTISYAHPKTCFDAF